MEALQRNWRGRARVLAVVVGIAVAGGGLAIEPKEPGSFLDLKEFFKQELVISSSNEPAAEIADRLPNRPEWVAFLAGDGRHGFVDPRSGAATNLIEARPLIPGDGVGNRVNLADLSQRIGREVARIDRTVVADAVLAAAVERRALLGIDTSQLGPPRADQITEDLWQVSVPQVYRGVSVRYGRLAATISHGNLVVFGTETWGDVRGLSTRPRVSADEAMAVAYDYLGGASALDELVRAPALEILPTAPPEHQRGEAFAGPIGAGYEHRLVWTWTFRRPPEEATWEVIVDAHDGELLSFQDANHYITHSITGGVYPVTSTEICPTAGTCGTMQSGWPMPWANTGLAAPNDFTNSAGLFDWTSGTTTTTLTGRYVRISDSCGTISNSSSTGSIALGGSNGDHDCTTGGGSAGNTAASRTAFYEVNKLAEQARGWLPSNTWLQARLTANVNLNSTCNAFWNGSTINFYRSGGGCRNTGELAGVFDHEWGHGLDANDTNGSLSNSSEAYADIAAIYRLQDSCVGHGFFWTLDRGCGQTADGTGFNANEATTGAAHCNTNCSGVRDADWMRHSDQQPDTALGFVCNSCSSGTGPCGRQVHCSAAPTRQAAWDLVARDLVGSPFNLDSQTAFLIGNKLFYQGSGNVGSWHACTCGSSSSGCGSTNGYMQWLAADDDNGNLSDGTPHMTAIHAAYNRHGIACSSPTPTNSGCSSGPTAAPSLSASAGNDQASLSWSSVSGATRYWVFRTEGHAGCDFGKTLVGETTGTSFTDTQVANGRQYHYNVVAAGSSSACFGRASACASVTPASSPDFSVSCSPSSLSVTQGANTTSTCTVTSSGGFSSAVSMSCANLPSGSSCSFSPSSVTPPANGSVDSTLTVTASSTATTGSFTIQVQGTSGSTVRSTNVGLTVNAAGSGGAQSASYDTTLKAPKCATVGSSCDSGTLLVGRDNMSGGAEPNQPNTINDSCADGTSGTFHSDESNDRVVVSTTDGGDFAPGKTVRIDATVWVWSGGPTSDSLDLYYAADATSPSWQYITTIVPTSSQGGQQTFSATYTLPTGPLQAVRARFRYQGSVTSCGTGSYIDHDDLIFAVDSPAPDFSVACSPSSLTVTQGGNASSTCTVTSSGGFSSSVSMSCANLPSGSSCSFSPSSVTPPSNGSASSTLTVSATSSATTGSFTIQVQGTSGSTVRSTNVGLTVDAAGGGGPQSASYDTTLKAPKCAAVGSSCDSGTLLVGRDNMSGGAEPNQPNTINNSCADGTSGTFHSDESNDRIVVSTTDGNDFAPGKTVRIDATVWVWSGGPTSDSLDLYYAADATSPSWQYITTIVPTSSQGGQQTFSATYTLPTGPLQAVRARFRYQGSVTPCGTGSYIDHDDLIFAVDSPAPTTVFFDDFETDQGWTRNPNGTDTATTGLWERGDPEPTNSNGPKQLGTTVSGVNDLVTGRLAGSGAGSHDIDDGVTTIRSPAITLPSSGTLTLSFWYYLAHGSNSSTADFLRVRVLGSTNALVFEELGAANNDDAVWEQHSADISSFAGQTVRILIEAADAAEASLVEAAVDDVLIVQQ